MLTGNNTHKKNTMRQTYTSSIQIPRAKTKLKTWISLLILLTYYSYLPADEDLGGRQRSRFDNDGTRNKNSGPVIGGRTQSHSLRTGTVPIVVVWVDGHHAEPIRHAWR